MWPKRLVVDEASEKGGHVGRASWVVLWGCLHHPWGLKEPGGLFQSGNWYDQLQKDHSDRSMRNFFFLKHDICDQKGDF